MASAHQLLNSYAVDGSEEAFQELVIDHLNLVYGVALRCLNGDAALAEDACQIVFQSLARKARTISPDTIMTGWLYRHAFHTASRMARSEKRRRLRETRAVVEQDPDSHQEPNQLEQAVGELLAGLHAKDRSALLLRFYEELSFGEIGKNLGVSEDAAQKRVSRAIEKLRTKLKAAGAGGATSALTAYLSAVGSTPVPATLAFRIGQQLAAPAAAGGGLAGLTAVTSLLVSMKTKAILVTAAIIVAAIPITISIRSQTGAGAGSGHSAIGPNPLPAPPKIPPGNTQAEIWARTKADPERLSEVADQCMAAAKQMLDAMNQTYRKSISDWQQLQKVIADPEIAETTRELHQENANQFAATAKALEREMAGFRMRFETYIAGIKGETKEAGRTLGSLFSHRAKNRGWGLFLRGDEPQDIKKEFNRLFMELTRAVNAGDVGLATDLGAGMIELAPNHPAGYIESIGTLLFLGELEEAEDALSISIKKFPDSAELLYLSGHLAFASGEYKEAQEIFATVAKVPDSDHANTFPGVAHEASLSGVISEYPDLRDLLSRNLADIPPVNYMEFEQRLASEFGLEAITDAWSDAIRKFGTLEEPEEKPVPAVTEGDGAISIEIGNF